MKFLKLLLLPIILIWQLYAKKVHKKYDPMFNTVSQATRNYRKLHTDPSYNPLPQHWTTGPRDNFSNTPARRHLAYNAGLHHAHHYHDTTHIMADKVKHMQ